jgi:UDP-N-acetyl-D-mannosaminuronic acid dehydrogenase
MIKGFDKVSIIGGAGHVGLPLALSMAGAGIKVIIIDKDKDKLKQISKGIMPFKEKKADKLLKNKKVLKNLELSYEANKISEAKYIIVVIGTPLDKDLKVDTKVINKLFKDY